MSLKNEFGLSFESALARFYGIKDNNSKKQINENTVNELINILSSSYIKLAIDSIISHDGHTNGPVDFKVIINNEIVDLSVKTNRSTNYLVCPQVIGQTNIINLIKRYYVEDEDYTIAEFKELIEIDKACLLLEYLDFTFKPYLLYYNHKRKMLKLIKYLKPILVNDDNIYFRKKYWDNGNSIFYKGGQKEIMICNYQIITKDNSKGEEINKLVCRFNIINLLKEFPNNFEVIDLF